MAHNTTTNMKLLIFYFILCLEIYINLAQGASINGHCMHPDHCRTIDAFCKFGICECNSATVQHNDQCVQTIESSPKCNSELDCMPLYGNRTICKNNACVCKEYHHLQNVGYPHLQCMKNRGLHENCMTDEDCYWGQDMLDKMRCIGGTCSCVPGYHEHQRTCTNGVPKQNRYSLFIITILLLVGLQSL